MQKDHPIFTRAADGTLSFEHIALYLANLRFLVGQTVSHMDRAIGCAEARGDAALSAHLAEKREEERGHDVWADRDLRCVRPHLRTVVVNAPNEAMRALVRFVESTIDRDPSLYLSYMFVAEYLTVLCGPSWLRLLEERCGIPTSSMTVIGNHVELDREHTEEALALIDQLVTDPRKLAPMRQVARDAIDRFDRFFAAFIEEADRHVARDVRVQAPAA
ncbi:MAG: hypothetical protein HOW73_08550 [Polyangiaceae bacterium]|nr:hypothetical protein [Polyangiaceae bacterium]